MKRFLLMLMLSILTCSFAWAAPSRAAITRVKATHPPVHRHHAHKAKKHRAPKRHRHAV